MRWQSCSPVSNIDAMWNKIAWPCVCNGKYEAKCVNNYGSDATIAHRDRREATHACKYVRDTNSACKGTARAEPAFLFTTAKQCRCGMHVINRMKSPRSVTMIVVPLAHAGTVSKPGVRLSGVKRLLVYAMVMPKRCAPTSTTVHPPAWQRWRGCVRLQRQRWPLSRTYPRT